MLHVRPTGPILLLSFLSFASAAYPQTNPFHFAGTRSDYPVNGSFAIADFNSDGYPDIVTSDSTNTVVIYLNDGTGHFHRAASISGQPASYFVTGDFNGDGIPDVAFTTYGSVGIALGTGKGTLLDVTYQNVDGSGDLRAADMNGDGKLDLVVGAYEITVLFGNGDGTLQPGIVYDYSGYAFAVADVNDDGYPDVVCSNSGTLQVLLNQDGFLQPTSSVQLPNQSDANSVSLGDVNGDGSPDAVIVTQSAPYTLAVFKNNGKGEFEPLNAYTLRLPSDNAELLDVTGNGILDVLLTQLSEESIYPSQNLRLWTGDGKGGFSASTGYATGGADTRMVLSSLRNNRVKDLVTGNSSNFSVLLNKGNHTFQDGPYFKLPGSDLQVTVSADFNGDGIPDLAAAVETDTKLKGNNGLSGAYILLGTGDESMPYTPGTRLFVPPDALDLGTADFNGDGHPDLAFVTGAQLVIYLGNGDGTFRPGPFYASTAAGLTIADFNSDGIPDIATSGVFVFVGNGDGSFQAPKLAFIDPGRVIASGGFTGDGKIDLLGTSANGGSFAIALGNGDGTFQKPVTYPYSTSAVALGDFNNDGLLDLATVSGEYVDVFLNLGAGLFAKPVSNAVGYDSSARNLAVGDFNEDGFLDVVTAALNIEIFSGNGNGTLQPAVGIGAANYPNFLLSGDVLPGTPGGPSIIAVGQNSAISFLANLAQ